MVDKREIEKVKNLLIKLDLKYQENQYGIVNVHTVNALLDFEEEYKKFNTKDALKVINDLVEEYERTEKALDIACMVFDDVNENQT